MQRATTGAAGELALRIGLDAGEPLPDGDDLYGTPVIVASRLCDAAGAGEILASEVVRQIAGPRVAELIQPAGALRLRGLAERVAAAAGALAGRRGRTLRHRSRRRRRARSAW